jgi:hypothetical protein
MESEPVDPQDERQVQRTVWRVASLEPQAQQEDVEKDDDCKEPNAAG